MKLGGGGCSLVMKRGKYWKYEMNELVMNIKNKNIRDLCKEINEFMRGYQPRSNLVKVKSGDLLADSHNTLNRWRNWYCNAEKV
jgi:hypothetical protein